MITNESLQDICKDICITGTKDYIVIPLSYNATCRMQFSISHPFQGLLNCKTTFIIFWSLPLTIISSSRWSNKRKASPLMHAAFFQRQRRDVLVDTDCGSEPAEKNTRTSRASTRSTPLPHTDMPACLREWDPLLLRKWALNLMWPSVMLQLLQLHNSPPASQHAGGQGSRSAQPIQQKCMCIYCHWFLTFSCCSVSCCYHIGNASSCLYSRWWK